MATLPADLDELTRFVGALFRYADAGTYASLRAFDQFHRDVPPELIWPVKINGDLSKLTDRAVQAIGKCGTLDHSVVFAPPICTFTNPERARGVDLANGLTLSVELDEGDTHAARVRLESLLGPATVVVASGGDWADQATGEIHTKLHLHWRLSEPTREAEDHIKLGHARDLAARLAGADPTGKPVVHPLRWPGSWNTKDKPRLARIITLSEGAEINLDEALDGLTEAVEAAGLAAASMPRSGTPQADPALVTGAMAMIPNPDVHYDQWIRFGYAAYRAMGGDPGFDIWDEWSKKSGKYNATETEAAWGRISKAIEGSTAPRTIGAGTIFFHAAQAGWVRPVGEMDGLPPVEEGYYQAMGADSAAAPDLIATPFDPSKFTTLEPRKWVYGHFLIRRFLSVMGAPGGAGKTAYAMAVGCSVALNRALLGESIHEAGPVWIYNLEDPEDEILRRLQAITIHHNINPVDLVGRLYLDSGRDRPLVIAVRAENGAIIAQPIVEGLITELKRRGIKLLIVDPFVKSHRLEENRNEQVDFAATLWNQVAAEADCSILLLHHFKKGGVSGEADAFRGASALVDAARAAVSLSTMSDKEADKLGIDDADRRFHVRVDNAKLNLAPPPSHAVWIRLNNIELPNGDKVQAASRWEPPSMWDGIPMALVVRVLDILGSGKGGEQFTLKNNGADKSRWAGQVIIEEIGHTETQARMMLAQWVKSGLLYETKYHSTIRRKEISGCMVDHAKVAEMRQAIGPHNDD